MELNNLKNSILDELQHGNTAVAAKRSIDLAFHLKGHAPLRAKALEIANGQNNADGESLLTGLVQQFTDLMESEPIARVEPGKIMLGVTEISKHYGMGGFTFKPASFNLLSGEMTGVVGQNGNGKTTLLRMLCGELMADSGTITYHGIEGKRDPYAIRQHVGFIPQRIPRWYGKLEDNLVFTLSGRGVAEEEIHYRVELMLKRLGLYKYRNHLWTEISSGYRTRFELARVLLTQPGVLVLDEPLANLDIMAQQTFLQDLRFMVKTELHHMSVILSSQQLHEVEQVSDKVIFIKEGNCLFKGETATMSSDVCVVEFIVANAAKAVGEAASTLNGTLKSEGNFYTLSVPVSVSLGKILQTLVSAGAEPTYFRDITHSTKRLF